MTTVILLGQLFSCDNFVCMTPIELPSRNKIMKEQMKMILDRFKKMPGHKTIIALMLVISNTLMS